MCIECFSECLSEDEEWYSGEDDKNEKGCAHEGDMRRLLGIGGHILRRGR